MKANDNMAKRIPSPGKNPFKVPEGYFESLNDRVMKGIKKEPATRRGSVIRLLRIQPYYAVAASITGLALVTYILLQTILGPDLSNDSNFDLSLLEDSGILYDEFIVAESFSDSQEDNYTDWEEGAITFLASNEVDIFQLIESY